MHSRAAKLRQEEKAADKSSQQSRRGRGQQDDQPQSRGLLVEIGEHESAREAKRYGKQAGYKQLPSGNREGQQPFCLLYIRHTHQSEKSRNPSSQDWIPARILDRHQQEEGQELG